MAIEDIETLFEGPERKGRNGSVERLRLERGEWQGKPTHTLRLLVETEAGWRWSLAKRDTQGRSWAALSLRAGELRALAAALLAAADAADGGQRAPSLPVPSGVQRRKPSEREQRELDRFDREHGARSG
jgi:hypothetical protein